MSKLGVGTVLAAIVIGTLAGVLTSMPTKTADAVTPGALPNGETAKRDPSPVDHNPQTTSAPAGAPQSPSIADTEWEPFVDAVLDTHKQYIDDLTSRSSNTRKLLDEWQQRCQQWGASVKDAELTTLLDWYCDRVFHLQTQYHVIESNFRAHVESLDQLVSSENAAVDRRQIAGDVRGLIRKCEVLQDEFRTTSERLAKEIAGAINHFTDCLDSQREASLAELDRAKRRSNSEIEDFAWQLDKEIRQMRCRVQSYQETVSTYRELTAHDVLAKVRAIENLSYKADHLCDRLAREVNVLREKQEATPEWRSFQSRKVMNLLEEVYEAIRAVEHEADRINIGPKPACCPR